MLSVTQTIAIPNWLNFLSDAQFLGLVVSGLLAVLLSFLVEWLQRTRRENAERKQTAMVLAYEVVSVKKLTKTSFEANTRILNSYREEIAQEKLSSMFITDMDFPRTIYDRGSTNLALLPSELVAAISEFYRGVDICNHVKRLANRFSETTGERILAWKASKFSADEEFQIRFLIKQFLWFSEIYLENLSKVNGATEEILKGLAEIAEFDESKVGYAPSDSPNTLSEAPNEPPR